jgi:hypothetical protein
VKIDDAQLAALSRVAQTRLEPRVLAYLNDRYPEFCASLGDKLPALISSAVQFARMNGLSSEIAVVTICELVIAYGPRFYQLNAWASYILSGSDAAPGERVARLREYLPEAAPKHG